MRNSVRRVTVRGLCQLSLFDRCTTINYANIPFKIMKLCKSPLFKWNITFCLHYIISSDQFPKGLQLHNQWGGPADVPWNPHICHILQQINVILGLVRPKQDFLHQTCFLLAKNGRYDRKDPSSVAVSLSPEASLLLGLEDFCLDFTFQKSQNHLI